ncbi:sensor histidine kinase [Nonomuraea maritima]|uniref:sensor histidine kinase n=1 Tax=Nonomuraea maritima TaxID=683260 RepID=UPI003718BC3C
MTGIGTAQDLDLWRGRRAARAGACVWLLPMGWPLWVFLSARPQPWAVVAVAAATAVFAASWLAIMWRMFSGHAMKPRPWALAGLVTSGPALMPVLGPPWVYLSFVFAVSAFGTALRGRAFAAACAATAALQVTVLLGQGEAAGQVWWVPIAVAAQAAAVDSLRRMGGLIARLDAARAEVGRLAVENERLRFARDLHDTLGHTLTSITIRSQLAARLAAADPGRAAQEMTEVERAARVALDEVRRAIAGYRAPSLSEELETATRNLGVAGIAVAVSPADGPVPAAAEALLAWAVREGATNVLRHSRARHCWIDLGVDATSATVEIRDDGRPAPDAANGGPAAAADRGGAGAGHGGSGLAGLAERVGGVGGRLEAGTPPGGGYRLHVRVPLGGGS